MSLIVKATTEKTYEPIEEGINLARCISIMDIGDQFSEKYEKSIPKVVLVWEFPDLSFSKDDGTLGYRVISKTYTASIGDRATLRKDLESWRGKRFTKEEMDGFDLKKVLGLPCLIQIVNVEKDGKTYSNIANLMATPKGTQVATTDTALTYYDITAPDWLITMEFLPEWIQKRIKESNQYKAHLSKENDPFNDIGKAAAVASEVAEDDHDPFDLGHTLYAE